MIETMDFSSRKYFTFGLAFLSVCFLGRKIYVKQKEGKGDKNLSSDKASDKVTTIYTSCVQPIKNFRERLLTTHVPDLTVCFDINQTILFEDSVKGADADKAIISALAERTMINEEMTYTRYVCDQLLPGSKSDKVLKQKRREQIYLFLDWLKQNEHPSEKEVLEKFWQIKRKISKSDENRVKIFDSFYLLLEKLKYCLPFNVILCTFGNDLNRVVHELNINHRGIKIHQMGSFKNKVLHIDNGPIYNNMDQIFDLFSRSRKNFGTTHDFEMWRDDEERSRSGKPFLYSSQAKHKGIRHLSLFFDDNIKGRGEYDIVHPFDVATKSVGDRTELMNKKIFQVNPIDAALNDDYFVDLIAQALTAHGYKGTAEKLKSLTFYKC